MPETTLTDDLDRLARHVECLERAAADSSAPTQARYRVSAMAALARTALETAGQGRTSPDAAGSSRTVPDGTGQFRIVPERLRTEPNGDGS